MKNNDSLLKITTTLAVTLLHAGIIALTWHASKPPEIVEVDNLTVVDIGSLLGDDQPAADGAPAPLENKAEPEPPKPQPEKIIPPKPIEKVVKPESPKTIETPKVQAVVRNDKPADITQPEKPVPQPVVEKPKPIEPPKPVEIPAQPNTTQPEKPTGQNLADSGSQNNNPNRHINGQENGNGSNPNSTKPSNGVGGDKNATGSGVKNPNGNGNKQSSGSVIQNGGYIGLPNPPYPANADGDEGTVKLSVLVKLDGSKEISVTQSSGSAVLDNAAKRAARNAKYRLAKVDGQDAPTRFSTSFTFKVYD
ncbi:TonB family protein [Wielerella bovis]|uniref:TonB family protein n=1 Tax=Wielerella bovis TaxID=2917790 RepID=UPI00201986D9|nr:TonB family protein [Wielerella bovis]ULJ65213.1 TonB family protein [Wielerella bovis]ULJ67559.1 TonB family protein [Wielerella bovis]